jgi:hypothetical protein
MTMQLGTTAAQTIGNRGPSVRSYLRRTLKKAQNADKEDAVSMRLFTAPSELDTYFSDAETVAKNTYQRAIGAGFQASALHRAHARLAAEKGWFRGHILYAGKKPIAFQEDYLRAAHCFNPYVGYDPAYADLNPGTLLLIKSWEALCAQAPSVVYDFGFGEGVYKQRLADACVCEGELLLFAHSPKSFLIYLVLSVNHFLDTSVKRLLNALGIYDAVKKTWRRKKRGQALS